MKIKSDYLHVAPLRKPGDEGTAMLCRVIDGGSPPEYPLMPLDVLVMLIAAERGTWTSELDGEPTCPSLDREAPCGYPGCILTCRVVGVLLPEDIKLKTWFSNLCNMCSTSFCFKITQSIGNQLWLQQANEICLN